jgi:phage gp45-like
MRSTVRDAAHRAFLTLTRAVMRKANDKPFMQEADIGLNAQEKRDVVERYQNYGFSSVPNPEKDQNDKYVAEAIAGFIGGNRAHAVVLVIDDRRARLRNMRNGEVAVFDYKGQRIYFHTKGIAVETEGDQVITHRVVKKPDDDEQSSNSTAGQKAGSKQDAQKARKGYTRITQDKKKHVKEVLELDSQKPYTRVTQDKDQILMEIIDPETELTKTFIRLDKDGITLFGANVVIDSGQTFVNAASQIVLTASEVITDGLTRLDRGEALVEIFLDLPSTRVYSR